MHIGRKDASSFMSLALLKMYYMSVARAKYSSVAGIKMFCSEINVVSSDPGFARYSSTHCRLI